MFLLEQISNHHLTVKSVVERYVTKNAMQFYATEHLVKGHFTLHR